MNAPCKGCTERTAVPNCHTTCKRYLDWKAGETKVKEKFRQKNQMQFHKIETKGWF